MSYRHRKQRRHRRAHHGRPALLGLSVAAAAIAIAALSGAGYVFGVAASAPALSELKPHDKGSNSVIFAADGSRLGYVKSDEIRTPVPSRGIPQNIRDATVAIEDERFHEHTGVDYGAIVRAGIKNLESGRSLQGGSTITQQLVRALYIENPERNIERKIREAKLASELEEQRSKQWILESYLNNVPYGTVDGRTAIGIAAAAEVFFDKHPRRLTLPEAALLAGLPQAPSQYNPFHSAPAALARRNQVLRQMFDNGYISAAERDEALGTPLRVKQGRRYTRRREPYFFDYVQEQLIERYGVGVARRGGLKVHTTIDPQLQDHARAAIDAHYADPAGPGSAIVSIDPANGEIRAMASSGSYAERTFNLAAQGRRQPGSAFKTMVLTAAVRKGVDPNATSYTSRSPTTLDIPGSTEPWEVSTFSGSSAGTMSLTRATLASDNSIYAQLILDIGPESVCETARLLGIRTKLDCYPAEGLGGLTRGVTPLEMANAYATLAAGGIRHRATSIRKVVFPDGKSESLARPKGKRVLTDGQAHEVTAILEQNVQSGTGTSASYGCPAAGKTGTTDEASDAWFVGYTPTLSTAVWVGYPNARTPMPNAQGGTHAAPVWGLYMGSANAGDCGGFPAPSEPAEFTPFYGEHATSGGSTTDSYYDSSYSTDEAYTEETGDDADADEAPPQEAPDPAPAPAPAPETGGGQTGGGGLQTP